VRSPAGLQKPFDGAPLAASHHGSGVCAVRRTVSGSSELRREVPAEPAAALQAPVAYACMGATDEPDGPRVSDMLSIVLLHYQAQRSLRDIKAALLEQARMSEELARVTECFARARTQQRGVRDDVRSETCNSSESDGQTHSTAATLVSQPEVPSTWASPRDPGWQTLATIPSVSFEGLAWIDTDLQSAGASQQSRAASAPHTLSDSFASRGLSRLLDAIDQDVASRPELLDSGEQPAQRCSAGEQNVEAPLQ